MSSLKDRILAGMGNYTPQHGNYHTALPAVAIPSHSHRGNELGAVKMQPTVMVGIRANHVSVQDLVPLYTADGAPVPATAVGTWGNLYKAGGPRRW